VTCNEEKQQEIISPSAACNVVKKFSLLKMLIHSLEKVFLSIWSKD
jgi:hypothetical protein